MDIENDEVKSNSEDVVLGGFDIIINNGTGLFIEDITFTLVADTNTSTQTLEQIFEDFELYDATHGIRYDLDVSACSTMACTLSEENIDIFLIAETTRLEVRADTVTMFDSSVADNVIVHLELDTTPAGLCVGGVASSDFVVRENATDAVVCDIVPSFIAFDEIELVEPMVGVYEIPLSDIDVIRGAEEIIALQFQIETDEVSSATLNGITFTGSANFNQTHVSAVRLYRGTPDGAYELMESQGGFDIEAGNAITFDDFEEVEIPVNSTEPFFVTLDIVDNSTLVGNAFNIAVGLVPLPDLEDDDNDDMQVTVNSAGTRTITIQGVAQVSCAVDTSDPATDRPSIVLGGTTSGLLGSFEIEVENEAVYIRDVMFTASPALGFTEAFEKIILLADDGVTELHEQDIITNVMYLDEIGKGVSVIIDEGTENVYVKLIAHPIGDSAA